MTAALAVRDLVARRGAFELRVPRLEVPARSALAIIGPNGAGKSTLLRSLAGLEKPARGRIHRCVDGPVTMVFQRPIAFSGSVSSNLAVALSGARLSARERRARTEAALAQLGIAHLAERRASTLSGGELRRLALARAFALRPSVLLLDEPFDDLDPAGQESLSLDLRRAIAKTGVGVAVAIHDLRRALLLADRIAVLLEGRVVRQGEREDVLARPGSADVAQLVGMSNLVEGTLEGSEVAIDPQHRIPVEESGAPSGPWTEGERVLVGICPERLKVEVGRGEGVPIGKAVVRAVVSDGVAATVTVTWAGRELRTHLLAGRGLARTIAPGDPVTLSVRPGDVHVMPRNG